ncbi:hypothetical protein GGG16DRAFT_66849 [Schizophyllum commune]
MRMKTATPEDRALALAMANMRYAACTKADLEVLRSRVVGSNPKAPTLSDPKFRDVSIITARHAEKDAFNELGSRRFATDTGQQLTSFYSCDTRASESTIPGKNKRKGRPKKPKVKAGSGISEDLQKIIWSSLPCFTGNIAGRLDLCKGMPVMIRSNIATELCITKGQEAIVVDWSASIGSQKQRILDVLYVKLINPPKNIKLEGLDENVVPLSRVSATAKCQLPNDQTVTVERKQIPVLLNFSMTDYASQGKTRPINVVNLTNSRSHQACYTALSRGTSAAATAIVSSFNDALITKGLDDQLKREFRNLEILNDITRLRYLEKLPSCVCGDTRNQLIRSFLDWKGPEYEIPDLHPALRWRSRDDCDDIDDPVGRQAWQFAEKEDEDSTDDGPETVNAGKRKRDNDDGAQEPERASKQTRTNDGEVQDRPAPRAYPWNSVDWSCSYDSLFTILHCIWVGDPTRWTPVLSRLSPFARELVRLWSLHARDIDVGWVSTRDAVRSMIHDSNPTYFPYGSSPASARRLAMAVLNDDELASRTRRCVSCGSIRSQPTTALHQCHSLQRERYTTAEWLKDVLRGKSRRQSCNRCSSPTVPVVTIRSVPDLLCLDNSDEHLVISHTLSYDTQTFKLRGIVYAGQNHFTCRVVDHVGTLYRHDGMVNGDICEKEAILARVSPDDLGTWRMRNGSSKSASLLVYERSA